MKAKFSAVLAKTTERLDQLTALIETAENGGVNPLGMEKTSKGGGGAGSGSGALDAIMTGDIVVLSSIDPGTAGLLLGDRVESRCGVQEHGQRQVGLCFFSCSR